jgi:hypothetical protein
MEVQRIRLLGGVVPVAGIPGLMKCCRSTALEQSNYPQWNELMKRRRQVHTLKRFEEAKRPNKHIKRTLDLIGLC